MNDLNCWESKFECCYYANRLITKIIFLNKNNCINDQVNLTEVKKAIYYAKKYHGSQKRISGEPYYSHPLEVAYLVSNYLFSTEAMVVSILHDTIEDTELTSDMIGLIFNPEIASKVNDLTRIRFGKKITSTEILEQLYAEQKKDGLIIKLFDRLHNLHTINVKSVEEIKHTVLETLKSFLTVAAYCQLKDIENMLSRLCFSIQLQLNLLEEQYYCFSYDNFRLPYLNHQNNILQMCSRLELEL